MSTYIKHSEDDSLTHYGVKGMKWRKRKKKNNEWSERVMYDAGGSSRLDRIRPFHDDGQSPDGKGYKSGQYNPSLKGTIERRKRLFKEGYYDRKEGSLKSRKNYPKAIKSSLNKAKKATMSTAKKAIKKGKDKWNQRYISKGVANEYMYTYNKKGQTVLLHKPGDRYDTRTGKAIKKKKK